jgi:hypothetical protein
MRHEPSGSVPLVQLVADRGCPACRAVKPPDEFPACASRLAGCCVACRGRQVAVARGRQRRALKQIARRAEAGDRALLAEHRRGGDNAA